jgi:hypothetical protein
MVNIIRKQTQGEAPVLSPEPATIQEEVHEAQVRFDLLSDQTL